MQVNLALKKRISTSSFFKYPRPSNCNVQPWQTLVVSADKKEQINAIWSRYR